MLRTNFISTTLSEARTASETGVETGGSLKSGNLGVGAAVYAATTLLMAAGLVHLWMMPGHFGEWWGYGAFYLSAALFQVLFGIALLRWPGQRLAFCGVWVNLGIVLIYLISRTSGLPVGPHAGVAEQAGVLDMMATASEVGAIILLVSLLSDTYRKFAVNGLLVLGLALWSLRLAGIVG